MVANQGNLKRGRIKIYCGVQRYSFPVGFHEAAHDECGVRTQLWQKDLVSWVTHSSQREHSETAQPATGILWMLSHLYLILVQTKSKKIRHCGIFLVLFQLLFRPHCLIWSESVDESVKRTKTQQHNSHENTHISCWPDVSRNILSFPNCSSIRQKQHERKCKIPTKP